MILIFFDTYQQYTYNDSNNNSASSVTVTSAVTISYKFYVAARFVVIDAEFSTDITKTTTSSSQSSKNNQSLNDIATTISDIKAEASPAASDDYNVLRSQ